MNFAEDREIGSCRVLHEGRGLETGHKSGQSLCFSLSPSTNTPSPRAHSLHPRPSHPSAEAQRAERERSSSPYQEEEKFEKRMPNSGHLKTILYTPTPTPTPTHTPHPLSVCLQSTRLAGKPHVIDTVCLSQTLCPLSISISLNEDRCAYSKCSHGHQL